MIKIDAHKIKHHPTNRHLFETIIHRKLTKINNATNFSTNLILNDGIENE